MKILIDTNRYTDFMKGDPVVGGVVSAADKILIPFVVLAELRAGFACGTIAKKNEAELVRFLGCKNVEVAYADQRTTQVYAELFAQLRKQGTPIPTNDLWIAALAVQHSAPLCTRDAHFEKLPQVARI